MEQLDSSIVHRNLDAMLKIGGLEALDFLLVLIVSGVMGMFFDSGKIGFLFVFIIPAILLLFLFTVKRNKPDGYLKDVFNFITRPGYFSASESLKHYNKLILKIKKKQIKL